MGWLIPTSEQAARALGGFVRRAVWLALRESFSSGAFPSAQAA